MTKDKAEEKGIKKKGFTKAEIIGLINQRISEIPTARNGWDKEDRKIAIEELKVLIRKIEGRKLISELWREKNDKR